VEPMTMLMGASALTSMAGGVVGGKGAQAGAAEAQRGAEVAAQGALFEGKATRDANYFNAGQYDFQALIDERNREIALAQAVADTKDTRRKAAAVNGPGARRQSSRRADGGLHRTGA